MVLKIVISAVIGYLLGSISFAIIMSNLIVKKDVRDYGSGNAGATNVARVFGMKAGVATFACDFIKTVLSMIIGKYIGGDNAMAAAAAACLIGHCFPVYFKFKGGKGVSVGATIGLMLDWRLFVILFIIFVVAMIFSKRVSVCSLADAVSFPVVLFLLGERSPVRLALGVFAMIVVVVMHHANIVRLIKGTEPKFKAGKSPGK